MFVSCAYFRLFRRNEGLSIKEFAETVQGNYRFISNIENGRSLPSLGLLVATAEAFPRFPISMLIAMLIKDKCLMDSQTLIKRLEKIAYKLSDKRYAEIRNHLALLPRGLVCFAPHCSDLIAFAGIKCDILLPNPCPDTVKAKSILVSTDEPIEGQQALIVNTGRPRIEFYRAEFHGSHPAFPIIGLFSRPGNYYMELALPRAKPGKPKMAK